MGKAHYESGGIAIARAIRAAYIKSPNLCITCNAPILPRDGEKLADARKKKFCSQRCNGKHSTPARIEAQKQRSALGVAARNGNERVKYTCADCGANANVDGIRSVRKYCKECWTNRLNNCSNILKKDSTHSKIRGHARRTVGVKSGDPCVYCGYNAFVEVAHIKAIKDFPDTATLGEMNNRGNLLILCRNHHWEMDHSLLIYDFVKKVLTAK